MNTMKIKMNKTNPFSKDLLISIYYVSKKMFCNGLIKNSAHIRVPWPDRINERRTCLLLSNNYFECFCTDIWK